MWLGILDERLIMQSLCKIVPRLAERKAVDDSDGTDLGVWGW